MAEATLSINSRNYGSPALRGWVLCQMAGICRECLAKYGGPFLFGVKTTMADAMYAPVCTRFITYDVKLDSDCAAYCAAIMALPTMRDWIETAKTEPEEVEELDVEF